MSNSECRMQNAECRQPGARGWGLGAARMRRGTRDSGLGVAQQQETRGWGLGAGGRGLAGLLPSRTLNPEPRTLCHRRLRRRGVSILEVMFAILVTVVGLFGAVAVFPAASAMARKGRVNDAAAAAGRSAVGDFDARGMRRPNMWWAFAGNTANTNKWDFFLPPDPPRFSPPHYTTVLSSSATRPGIRYPLGTAFCIDPRTIGLLERDRPTSNASNHPLHALAGLFPAVDRANITLNPQVPGLDARSVDPRMFRITMGATPNSTSYMSALQADGIFSFDDDLSYERSDQDRSLPATQLYDYIGGTKPNPLAKRLSDGHLTWMATLVPKVEIVQRNVNPSDPATHGFAKVASNAQIMWAQPTDEYVLSIVVFHDREFDPNWFDPANTEPTGERLVAGALAGDGSTGGEVELYANDPRWLKLRSHDWVLLSGVYTYRHPNSGQTVLSNVPAFQWYRVTDCDSEPEQGSFGPGNPQYTQRIYASLMGQDWNKDIVNPVLGTGGQYTFQATIVQGVVAVYEKTVRLEY